MQYTSLVSKKGADRSGIWSQVFAAVAIAFAIWAIVLVLVSKFLGADALLTIGISVASSVLVVGVAAYGIGSWRNQARLRVRHNIAHAAIEASLEALERLAFARSRLTDQIASFRGAEEREEPLAPEDKQRLLVKIDETDAALKHLRTAHELVRIHLDDLAACAVNRLVELGREYTRTTNLHFSGAMRELSEEQSKREICVLHDFEDNPFSIELDSAWEEALGALKPHLLSG